MAPAADSTTRFSSRVADYISSRPTYPSKVLTTLSEYFDLPDGATIADIGSGTGISSALALETLSSKDIKVIGIEPNQEMREAGDELLAEHVRIGKFQSMDGTAEKTGLKDSSVDLIIAAQAFHWFDVPKARQEFKRILKPGKGGVGLIWNDRRGVQHEEIKPQDRGFPKLDSPVMNAFDLLLLKNSEDYQKVCHHNTVNEQTLRDFFGPDGFKHDMFPNPYRLTYEQLKGRLLSSSYTPQAGHQGHDEMMKDLQQLFDQYQREGKVDFMYDARVFYGAIS